jgi:hypothetical protein
MSDYVVPWMRNEPINNLKEAFQALGITAAEFKIQHRHVLCLWIV